MIELFDNDTGELIGEISEAQLEFLEANMEEESIEDRDYAIEMMTLAYFQEQGIDPELLKLLKNALGVKEQIIIRWSRL
jgi:hypothetical protein